MNSNKSVLVADDTEEIGKACERELQSLGYNTTLCRREGEEVIKKLNSCHYDAVLLDVFMAGCDGIEVIRYISENLAKQPLIFTMAEVTAPQFEEQIMECGSNYHFIKPIKPEIVAKRIEMFLSHRDRKSATAPANIETIVSNIMRQIGVPAHIKGYQYLRRSIILCVNDKTMISSVTKILYPAVAKEFQTTQAAWSVQSVTQ